jgi:hypothetical protein
MLLVFVQRRVTSPSGLVLERCRVMVLGIRFDPIVNALPGYAKHAGQLGSRTSVVELQNGQSASKETGIQGLRELTPETLSLPRSEIKLAHVLLLNR